MRAGFAGTPEFAAVALAALHERGYTIPLVLTQPDRPSGRGMVVTASPVKRYALAHDIPVAQPPSLRNADAQAALRAQDLDVLVVAAYGLILPQAVLDAPRHGCLNIHASLLPRWRGAAPIVRAIEAGDQTTGITIMQMDAGLDTGPMLRRASIPIESVDTAGTLHDRLASLGASLCVEVLDAIAAGHAPDATPQPSTGATYAAKVDRAERAVDWSMTASSIDRKVRALSPAPGATGGWRGAPFRIVQAVPLADASIDGDGPPPGTVVAVTAAGLDVVCGGRTTLRLSTVQPAGGRAMAATAFAAGRGIVRGVRLDATVA